MIEDKELNAKMSALARKLFADAPIFRASGPLPKNSHRPVPTVMAPPAYPIEMAKAGTQALVWVAFIINAKGDTERVEILSDTQPSFTQAAKAAVLKWKYSPAIIDGQPVSIMACQAIGFTLN